MIPLNVALNNGLPAPHGTPASIDFETRSEVDIKSAGARRYAQSPTTDVLCLAIKIGPAEAIWAPGYPIPTLLAEAIERGEFLAAWHASFEIAIWQEIMVPRYGWPDLPVERFKCTMQRAAIVGCPGALEKAAAALRLPVQKDMEGHRLMMKMCKPLPERKGDAPGTVRWHDDPADHLRLQEYCMGDVRTEALAASYLPEPPPMEVAVMRVDRYINMRGVTIDKLAAEGAAKIARVEKARLNGEMKQITNGTIGSTNQVAAILEFIGRRGVIMDKLRAADVRAVLADEDDDESSGDLDVTDAQIAAYGAMDPIAKRVLELRAEAAKASTSKLDALVKGTLNDGRMVDLFAYAGAYRTGRFAGRRFQAQNLPRANPPCETEDEIEAWYDALRSGDHEYFTTMLPKGMSVMDGLKSSLRGFITASKGRMLNVADLSQIEARGAAWAAGQWDVIEAFERLDDAVRAGADEATIKSLDIYTVTGKKMGTDRQGGKVGILGAGYQASGRALSLFAAAYGLNWDETKGQEIVDAWRAANPMIVAAWGNEERAAKQALANPGSVVVVSDGRSGSYCYKGGNLLRKLPSGRVLVYRNMKLENRPTSWGQNRLTLTYESNTFAKGRPGEFVRLSTYAGKLFQNCAAEGTEVLTDRGWIPIEYVRRTDRVWDGEAWVSHAGVICNGVRPVRDYDGLRLTPDHKILTDQGWMTADGAEKAHRYWLPVRLPDGSGRSHELERQAPLCGALHMREGAYSGRYGHTENRPQVGSTGLHFMFFDREELQAWHVTSPDVCSVGRNGSAMHESHPRGVEELWGARHNGVREMADVLEFSGGHGASLHGGSGFGPCKQQRGVLSRELPVDNTQDPSAESQGGIAVCDSRPIQSHGDTKVHAILPVSSRPTADARVFDIVACGPRERFVVRDVSGRARIIHNCVQAFCRDILAVGLIRAERAGLQAVFHVHDEQGVDSPTHLLDVESDRLVRAMTDPIPWVEGLPIMSSADVSFRYRKN